MTSIILHTRRHTVNKNFFTHLVFIYKLTLIFRILRSWKARFSHTTFRTTSYVLMILKWLEVSNRVRNWNKVKNFIFVESKLELCQLEMLIFKYKLNVSEFINKRVSFLFCDFNRVTSWKEGKNIILLRSSSQIPNRNTGFIFKTNVCQCKHVFSK